MAQKCPLWLVCLKQYPEQHRTCELGCWLDHLSLSKSVIVIHLSPPQLLKWYLIFKKDIWKETGSCPIDLLNLSSFFSCHLACSSITCVFCKLKFISKCLMESQVEDNLVIIDDTMSFILYHIESYMISDLVMLKLTTEIG